MKNFSIVLDEEMNRLFMSNEEIWKVKRDYGGGILLYPAEIHLIDKIGRNPLWNLTELAYNFNVTKGAASKWITKLEKKGVLVKYNSNDNKKEIYFKLTETGEKAFKGHIRFHEEKVSKVSKEYDNYSDSEKDLILKFINNYVKEIEKYKK